MPGWRLSTCAFCLGRWCEVHKPGLGVADVDSRGQSHRSITESKPRRTDAGFGWREFLLRYRIPECFPPIQYLDTFPGTARTRACSLRVYILHCCDCVAPRGHFLCKACLCQRISVEPLPCSMLQFSRCVRVVDETMWKPPPGKSKKCFGADYCSAVSVGAKISFPSPPKIFAWHVLAFLPPWTAQYNSRSPQKERASQTSNPFVVKLRYSLLQ